MVKLCVEQKSDIVHTTCRLVTCAVMPAVLVELSEGALAQSLFSYEDMTRDYVSLPADPN